MTDNPTDVKEKFNSLGTLVQGVSGIGPFGEQQWGSQLSQSSTLYFNNRNYLISNQRNVLASLYVEHGIVQTLVDQPVDDGFRAGFEIKCGELSEDQIKLLYETWEDDIQNSLMMALKWARLFGGGAVLLITDQDPSTPMDWAKVNADTLIEWRGVDMWELYQPTPKIPGVAETAKYIDPYLDEFMYYGIRVHPSRVRMIKGKEAPSWIRSQLRGWGMSEVEKLVRSLNQYLKNQDVVFEILDEAKVDVYGIEGLNMALASTSGTENVIKRVQHANVLKNYLNALVMDAKDTFESKTMTFTGLAEMLVQIRIGIAADLKMPITKLFGISSAGFNSGEDDIENYNSMIEGEIRRKAKPIVKDMLKLNCQRLFGMIPQTMDIEWNPLRILKATEEEEVKEKQSKRVQELFNIGLINAKDAKTSINKDRLIPIEIDENEEALPPIGIDIKEETVDEEK